MVQQCALAGHVDLTGSNTTYRYRYKEFFGETSGWQVIDPDTGAVLYASDDSYQDTGAFGDYETVADEAIAGAQQFDVTVSYPDQILSDLTDDDSDDAIDPSGGYFLIAVCDGTCPTEVSEDGESTYLAAIGQSYLTYDADGNLMVEDYTWGELSADQTYGLYYYDYADINDAGYPKAKLVTGGTVTVTATE